MYEDQTELYCIEHSSAQSQLLNGLERTTCMRSVYPRMISGTLQGRFLSFISKLVNPTRILEIGTFTGFSALCLCEGLQPDGELITIDNNPEIETIALHHFNNSPWAHRIKMMIGDAQTLLPRLHDRFDLIFLDADKENYPNYYPLVKRLLNRAGLLLADNVLWGGKVLDQEHNTDKETRGIVAFNQMLANDRDMEVLMLPLRDGITVARQLI